MTSPNSSPNPAVSTAESAAGPALAFDDTRTAFAHRSTRDLRRARWMFGLIGAPALVTLGARAIRLALALRLPLNWALRPVFDYFCGGEDIEESLDTARKLSRYGVKTILDYSAEGQTGEGALNAAHDQIMSAILSAKGDARFAFAVFKVSALSDNALLEKVSGGGALTANEQLAWQQVEDRVSSLCTAACNHGVPIMMDAEESWLQTAIDALAETMMRRHNTEGCRVYTTAQLYRHDRLSYIKQLQESAQKEGWVVGVKLVRGAYMEKERERAIAEGRTSPIQPDKAATDRDFDAAVDFALQHLEHVNIVCGTHNEKSTFKLSQDMRSKGLQPGDGRVAFAQLLGMSDNLSFNLAAAGFQTAKYVPYGPLREAIPYLIRRAEENTSVGGQTSRELELIRQELRRRKAQ
ncbi:MAG: proline dehydrogenase family protein [Flavobacteriales bacterium]|nr:proline dehydrogenase family protein [Flavobacteriales bacterium]